ncbi:MAG: hypothetical protein U0935_10210 [Pirellulales bacterium]
MNAAPLPRPGLVLRPATGDDVDRLAAARDELIGQSASFAPAPNTRPDSLSTLRAQQLQLQVQQLLAAIQSGVAEFWLALSGEEITGWLQLNRTPPPSAVRCPTAIELVECQATKLGRKRLVEQALMERALLRARQLGTRRVWAQTDPREDALHVLLNRWNFVRLNDPGEDSGPRTSARLLWVRGLSSPDRLRQAKHRLPDAPLINDTEVTDLVAQFESGTWPYERWNHRAHLAVGLMYLRTRPLAEALERMRSYIRLYNQTLGDPAGYHETITQLFLRAIVWAEQNGTGRLPLAEAVAELVIRFPFDWLYQHYSRERLWSSAARRAWVEPDRQPLTFA